MTRSFVLILAFLLAACNSRPETPEYFTKATGIPLCDSAVVRNVRTGVEGAAGMGFVYSVDLYMDEKCQSRFVKDLRQMQGQIGAGERVVAQPVGKRIRVTYIG